MRPTCISLWSSCQRRFARSHCRHMALQDPSRTPPLRRGKRLFACAQYHKQRLRFPIDHARVYLFQARRACPRPVVAAGTSTSPSFAGVEGA